MTFIRPYAALALVLSFAQVAQAQNGEQIVKARCQICHAVTPDGKPGVLAPNLRGVVGRKAASSSFTSYSPALKASGLVWNRAKLDAFLQGPSKLVPGTKMVVTLSDAAERKNVLDYLTTLK